MAGRSPARFLAPLALVAFLFALFVVINSSQSGSSTSTAPNQTSAQPTATPAAAGKKQPKQPRRYTVKPGDTPSSIADKTGVPLEQILQLNPNLDPQALSPGERLRLR